MKLHLATVALALCGAHHSLAEENTGTRNPAEDTKSNPNSRNLAYFVDDRNFDAYNTVTYRGGGRNTNRLDGPGSSNQSGGPGNGADSGEGDRFGHGGFLSGLGAGTGNAVNLFGPDGSQFGPGSVGSIHSTGNGPFHHSRDGGIPSVPGGGSSQFGPGNSQFGPGSGGVHELDFGDDGGQFETRTFGSDNGGRFDSRPRGGGGRGGVRGSDRGGGDTFDARHSGGGVGQFRGGGSDGRFDAAPRVGGESDRGNVGQINSGRSGGRFNPSRGGESGRGPHVFDGSGGRFSSPGPLEPQYFDRPHFFRGGNGGGNGGGNLNQFGATVSRRGPSPVYYNGAALYIGKGKGKGGGSPSYYGGAVYNAYSGKGKGKGGYRQ